MSNIKTNKPAYRSQNGAINPFARALAETEKPLSDRPNSTSALHQNSLFSQALSRAGENQFSQTDMEQQQKDAEKLRNKEIQRQRQHDLVNPVDMVGVFSRREKEVEREITQIRQQLLTIVPEVQSLEHEIALFQDVVEPGLDGSYYLNFFHQFKSFILLFREKVRSARTWARQMNAKSAKKKRRSKFGAGIDITGNSYEQTTAVFDTMHHERSNAYAGG